MNAKVDNRTAARTGSVGEPAAGIAVTSYVLCLRQIYIANVSVIYIVFYNKGFGSVSGYKTDHKKLVVLLCALQHLYAFICVICHRLLAENVKSRIQSSDGTFCVVAVPNAYVCSVEILFSLEHSLDACVSVGYTEFIGSLVKTLLVDITDSGDLYVV